MPSVPAVRILPMDRNDFRGQTRAQVQRNYFRGDLIRRQGRFYFYEKGLRVDEGAIVLFQYDNAIIALAEFVDSERYKRPKWERCWGHLDFKPDSIQTFTPVSLKDVQKIWPEVAEFGQVKWTLDPQGYQQFRRLTLHGATIAEALLRAVSLVVGSDRKMVFSRAEVREAAGIDRRWWEKSWNPIFQGMRIDHPGRAPKQAKKHRGVLKRISHGRFMLTAYGWQLVRPAHYDDDGQHGQHIREIARRLEEAGKFEPSDQSDERERKLAQIALRRGRDAFRRALLRAYEGKCAVTRCDAAPALEAAHILPYRGKKSDSTANGLLLRSDIHTLFDLDLIGIRPRGRRVVLAESLLGTSYESLAGKELWTPIDPAKQPNVRALAKRWKEFQASD